MRDVFASLEWQLLDGLRYAGGDKIWRFRGNRAGSRRQRIVGGFRRKRGGTRLGSRGASTDGLSGRLGFAETAQIGFAFEVAHMAFESAAQFGGGAPEFGHDFAEIAREFGELLGSKYDQSDREDDDQVWDTKHGASGTKVRPELRFPTASPGPFLNHRRGLEACQTAEKLYAIIRFLGLSEDAWNQRGRRGVES